MLVYAALRRKGVKIQMRRLARTLLYTLALLTVLGIAGFQFYHSTSQVENRLQTAIREFVSIPVRIEGCTSDPFGGGIRIGGLAIRPAPQLGERELLTMRGITVVDSAFASESRAGLRAFTDVPGLSAAKRVRVESASLTLEYQRSSIGRSGVGRWNFEDVFREREKLSVAGYPLQVVIDRLSVGLRQTEGEGRRVQSWDAALSGVEVRPRSDDSTEAIVLEGVLEEGRYWAGGQVEVRLGMNGAVDLRGDVYDFRLLAEHRELLTSRWRPLLSEVDPSGTVDLRIESVSLPSREPPRTTVLVRHYDTALRLGEGGAWLRHLRGVMEVGDGGVRADRAAPATMLTGELWGVTVGISGASRPKRGRWRLE